MFKQKTRSQYVSEYTFTVKMVSTCTSQLRFQVPTLCHLTNCIDKIRQRPPYYTISSLLQGCYRVYLIHLHNLRECKLSKLYQEWSRQSVQCPVSIPVEFSSRIFIYFISFYNHEYKLLSILKTAILTTNKSNNVYTYNMYNT